MFDYGDKLASDLQARLGKDWHWVRDHQAWGYCPTFRNEKTRELRFYEYVLDSWNEELRDFVGHVELFDCQQEYDHLMKCWRPVRDSDITYKEFYLKRDLLN